MPACFKQDGYTAVEQRLHQRIDLFLQERLAPSDLDERTVQPVDLRQHLIEAMLVSLMKKVYVVSHHEQRRSHAVNRTKTHGRPAYVDSP